MAFVVAIATRNSASAQATVAPTPDIFRQYSEHVVRIEVVEIGSALLASLFWYWRYGRLRQSNSLSKAMEYSAVLNPIEPRLLPATAMDRFIESPHHLKKELNALARRARSSTLTWIVRAVT